MRAQVKTRKLFSDKEFQEKYFMNGKVILPYETDRIKKVKPPKPKKVKPPNPRSLNARATDARGTFYLYANACLF